MVYFIRRVPETKGRSLAAIEADLRRRQLPLSEEHLPPGQIGHAA
jgi:hypothetical protein